MSLTMEKKSFKFDAVRHLYALDGKPLIGTTTALQVLSKELTWWASGMACAEFGWLNPKKSSKDDVVKAAASMHARICGMAFPDYLDLLNRAYRAHSAKKEIAKDSGIDMHSLLEDFIKSQMEGRSEFLPDPRIQPFRDWSAKHVKRFLFSEICCYSEVLWCGGKPDFAYEDMEGNYALGDFKSAAGFYYSYYLQLGAYDFQISENGGFTPKGEKIFHLDKPFKYHAIFAERVGLDKPSLNHDIDRVKKAWVYLVRLYQEKMFFEKDRE